MSKYLVIEGRPFILDSGGLVTQVALETELYWDEERLQVMHEAHGPVIYHEVSKTLYGEMILTWMQFMRIVDMSDETKRKLSELKVDYAELRYRMDQLEK